MPLVDFFCDPAGLREEVNTALVNKRRGLNAYFPMPFRRSARVELVYDGPLPPGEELWRIMPCYSYVMYRTLEKVPDDAGYFHAYWRQEALLLGKRDYVALEAKGQGQVRRLERHRAPAPAGPAIRWTRTRSSSSTARQSHRSSSRGWKTRSASVGAFRRPRANFR